MRAAPEPKWMSSPRRNAIGSVARVGGVAGGAAIEGAGRVRWRIARHRRIALDASSPDAPSAAGAALSFSGQGSVEAPAAFVLPTGDFTLEAWVFPVSGEMQILAKEHGRVAANQFRLGTPSLPLNGWSHVAVTRSGATFTLYVGSTAAATVTFLARSRRFSPTLVDLRQPTPQAIAASVDVDANGRAPGVLIEALVAVYDLHSVKFVRKEEDVARWPRGRSRGGRMCGQTRRPNWRRSCSRLGAISYRRTRLAAWRRQRVWSVARPASELAATILTNIDADAGAGLVADWRFNDCAGTSAADQTGHFPATLQLPNGSPAWTPSTAY